MSQSHHGDFGRRISRRRVLAGGGVTAAGLAGAALIGCGSDDDGGGTPGPTGTATQAVGSATATSSPVAAGGPRAGGLLGRQAEPTQENFNPVTNFGEGVSLSGVHVYDRLLSPRTDERGYVLEAAESIEVQDETTVVVKLKEGMVYQDRAPVNGRAVVADDIVKTQEYVQSEPALLWGSFPNDVLDHAEAPDERTVVFHLKQPTAYLFSFTQLGNANEQAIIPAEVLEDLNTTEPVGSGPYVLGEYQLGVSYRYARNPTYRESGRPYIDERLMLRLPDAAALEAAFRSEQIQVWLPSADQATSVSEDLGDSVRVVELGGLSTIYFNASSKRETWDDPRLREALYRAVNVDQYVELVSDGWGTPVPAILPAGLPQYWPSWEEARQYKYYDAEAGRQLLDAAGLDLSQAYTISSLSSNSNEAVVQVFQQQLLDIGLQTQIDMRVPPDWIESMAPTGNYDFFAGQQGARDTPQVPLRLHHTDTRQVNKATNLGDPEVDALIEQSEVMTDPEEHTALVQQIQLELLKRYAHLMVMYSPVERVLIWDYLKDWEDNAANNHPMYQTQAWLDV